ncbi:MAG: pyrophosphohydrolase [Pseudomonadota bacterium]|jgi:putative (di)nucleoside polyphosphate hydrolase
MLRKNVGLIILNHTNELLLCKRRESNAWQFPQGGVDGIETEKDAAMRELFEEVGVHASEIKVLAVSKFWYEYFIPNQYKKNNPSLKNFKGQSQKWYLLKFRNKKIPNISFVNDHCHEFNDFKWVSYWYPLSKIVFFKKDVYRKALCEFLPIYNKLI